MSVLCVKWNIIIIIVRAWTIRNTTSRWKHVHKIFLFYLGVFYLVFLFFVSPKLWVSCFVFIFNGLRKRNVLQIPEYVVNVVLGTIPKLCQFLDLYQFLEQIRLLYLKMYLPFLTCWTLNKGTLLKFCTVHYNSQRQLKSLAWKCKVCRLLFLKHFIYIRR